MPIWKTKTELLYDANVQYKETCKNKRRLETTL